MQSVYHKNGIIYVNHDGFNFTISNDKQFFEFLKKIKNHNYDNDERISFVMRMTLFDLLNSARREQIIFQEKACLKNYP